MHERQPVKQCQTGPQNTQHALSCHAIAEVRARQPWVKHGHPGVHPTHMLRAATARGAHVRANHWVKHGTQVYNPCHMLCMLTCPWQG